MASESGIKLSPAVGAKFSLRLPAKSERRRTLYKRELKISESDNSLHFHYLRSRMNLSLRILFLLALVISIDALTTSEQDGEGSQVMIATFDVLTTIQRRLQDEESGSAARQTTSAASRGVTRSRC